MAHYMNTDKTLYQQDLSCWLLATSSSNCYQIQSLYSMYRGVSCIKKPLRR